EAGNDTLVGGQGDDTYVVDSVSDIITESLTNALGGGTDTVESSISWGLAALTNIDNLTLTGSANINGTGNALANTITGNSGNNILDGGAGNDTLVGGLGNDTLLGGLGNDVLKGGAGNNTLKGGTGNDIYEIESTTDTINEEANNDTGDLVQSHISVNLTQLGGGKIENGLLLGSDDINLVGNAAANILTGNAGDNVLNGMGGNDTLRGGTGNDIYVVDSAGDVIDEQGNADTGDEVQATISINLAALGAGKIENAMLLGGENINATGSAGDNILRGNAGSNIISGLDGDDHLIGGVGDQLLGGADEDVLQVNGSSFALANGGAGQDTLLLGGSGMSFDLESSVAAIQSIEKIDLGAAAANSITISAAAIAALSPGAERMLIDGGSDDLVRLDSTFSSIGTEVIGGDTYNVYGNGVDQILIEESIAVQAMTFSALTSVSIDANMLDGDVGFGINGNVSNAMFGAGTINAGDVNHDGYDDVIIRSKGGTAVFYGAVDSVASSYSVGDLDGTNGFKIPDATIGLPSGVAAAGDIDGDGNMDFVLSRSGGGGYILFGSDGQYPASVVLDGAINQVNLSGVTFDSCSVVGDVNGDGYDDFVVGSSGQNFGAELTGGAFLVYGHAGGFPSDIDLSSIDAGEGVRLEGAGNNDLAGYSVSSAGDINGDGLSDFVIGVMHGNLGSEHPGRSYIVFGSQEPMAPVMSLANLNGINGFTFTGNLVTTGPLYDLLGSDVAAAGDINGDGYDDIIVGSMLGGVGDNLFLGAAYVVFGHSGGFSATLNVNDLNGTNGFRIAADGGWFGASVASAGDFNGDGYADIIVGAPMSSTAYVLFGHSGGFSANMSLSNLGADEGFKIDVGTDERLGYDVSSAGDLNGDGYDDVIVGAVYAQDGGKDTGAAYVVFGHSTPNDIVVSGDNASNTLIGSAYGEIITGGQGNDTIDGGGGEDSLNGGAGDDQLHLADNHFYRVDGGNGLDTLHLDFAGSIDFGDLDNDASTSDRGRIAGIEVIDVDNGLANSLTLHLSDILDLDVQNSNVGGNTSLDNALRINGDTSDILTLSSADGWTTPGSQPLSGYQAFQHQGVTVLVDNDISVTVI
ncbi:MAG: FG-GAP repeat protein, partial [Proteobacteria bacterium]|nr:FG-GAP repeat protein [Pseudomonadota bacterium]